MRKAIIGLVAGLTGLISVEASAQQSSFQKVADGVYHFWHTGYSSMAVIGQDGVLITDPAFTFRAKALKQELEKVTDLPVKYVALSHEHYDHVGGTEQFTGAQVICHLACQDVLDLSPMIQAPKIDVTFDKKHVVDLGNKKVELHHPAMGDGAGTMVAWVPEAKVSFSVDMYEPRGFTVSEFKEDTNFVGTRKILNTMVDWQPEYAINGHSPGNSIEALKENATLYDKLYETVLAAFNKAMAEGGPEKAFPLLFTISGTVKMDEYKEWKDYDKAFPGYVRRMALSIFHGG